MGPMNADDRGEIGQRQTGIQAQAPNLISEMKMKSSQKSVRFARHMGACD